MSILKPCPTHRYPWRARRPCWRRRASRRRHPSCRPCPSPWRRRALRRRRRRRRHRPRRGGHGGAAASPGAAVNGSRAEWGVLGGMQSRHLAVVVRVALLRNIVVLAAVVALLRNIVVIVLAVGVVVLAVVAVPRVFVLLLVLNKVGGAETSRCCEFMRRIEGSASHTLRRSKSSICSAVQKVPPQSVHFASFSLHQSRGCSQFEGPVLL